MAETARPTRFVVPLAAVLLTASAAAGQDLASSAPDTAGMAQKEWVYDSWTVPWTQVRGTGRILAPSSHATLMTLGCETAHLERDRLARHLSAEECEHRMASIRTDQDSALTIRIDLRVLGFDGTDPLARLRPGVTFQLETDRGGPWQPVAIARGPVIQLETGRKPRRIHYYYDPLWVRSSGPPHPAQNVLTEGRSVTVGEHRLRFERRDPPSQQLVIGPEVRWMRLRMRYVGHEWVATWAFRSANAIDR